MSEGKSKIPIIRWIGHIIGIGSQRGKWQIQHKRNLTHKLRVGEPTTIIGFKILVVFNYFSHWHKTMSLTSQLQI